MSLRGYQAKGRKNIEAAWDAGHQNVLYVLPTGGGKTKTFSNILLAHLTAQLIGVHRGASCAIAHRQELVSQISLALAKDGVRHRIIAPVGVIKTCVKLHMKKIGKSFYDPQALCGVAGVDTLIRRVEALSNWLQSVTLWVQDEAHHVLKDNKWGTAASLFPNANGLGVTATPLRADGAGLGRHADGIFDIMIVGPTMRDLINAGYLVDYRIFAPPSDLDLSEVQESKTTGDYNKDQLVKAVHKSHIMGDVVTHYKKIAYGKAGLTFAVDIATATEIAERFNAEGVPAAVVSSNTSDEERFDLIQKLQTREIWQLVNVDIFGEGTDVPLVEVVSFARPTASYSLYIQQFGRALRLLLEEIVMGRWEEYSPEERRAFIAKSQKPNAIIIDHVGNVLRHGLPDAPRVWSLDRRDRKSRASDPNVIPVRACPQCAAVFERVYAECPDCGFKPKVAGRAGPEQVDGDLCEMSPEVLAQMRAEINRVDMDASVYRAELAAQHCPIVGQEANVKRHVARQEAQALLRDSIAWWAGYRRAQGMPDSESYRRFYFTFGIDVMTAQTLGTNEAMALLERVEANLIY